MPRIQDARILIMATDGFEQSELMEPLERLKAKGATVDVAAPKPGEIKGWKEKNWGDTVRVDVPVSSVQAESYDALVLPGGQMNPDVLRMDSKALAVIGAFLAGGKIVAAICHAPWLLIEAKAVQGRRVTSYRSIRTDVLNAGGNWVDEEVVVDDGIITSRSPADLPAFIAKIVEEVEEGRHYRREAA
ncbi:MAG TPA: type 1 glutamine amidotransferase domain-containing protein [Sphingomicrobium sp.]|nr:type 1 glutamine amidotransferase domain-containing protein [Sphingomicrobium sp.]